jgi:hypothetical protein
MNNRDIVFQFQLRRNISLVRNKTLAIIRDSCSHAIRDSRSHPTLISRSLLSPSREQRPHLARYSLHRESEAQISLATLSIERAARIISHVFNISLVEHKIMCLKIMIYIHPISFATCPLEHTRSINGVGGVLILWLCNNSRH